ncbi:YlzJ-like family protein [Massiliimalia massiliensis]|uniref:YlzJ-like family protein n=1 Tax=Massiliimalia massiliensis TaxID=1852384 RepID=UPI00135666BC|nr:YlzJ-like family protein [Massiliimalia massiliensis]
MLYTIIDENEIFAQENQPSYFYKRVDNCILEGVKYNQDVMLNRIISTNPKDYLNPKYSLGMNLKDLR